MIQLALRIFALTLVATATTAYAADTLFGTPTTTTNSTNTGRFKSRLSSDNYLNSVQQLNSQTNNSLSQQVKDLYPKKGAAPTIANQPQTTTPNQPAGSVTISNPPPASATQTTTTTRPAGTYQSPMTNQPPAQQSETYTGFGGGTRSTTPTNSGSSTGLGIKY